MATGRLRRAVNALAVIASVLAWLAALIWFAQVAQNSEALSRLQSGILLASVVGIVVLLLLIFGNLVQLIRDYRHHVPGARLKARMVTLLVVLTVVPLLVVYTFSLQFINRGIDSWFSVEVEEGLETSLELSKSALDVQMRENLGQVRMMAQRLASSGGTDIVGEFGDLGRESGAVEVTISELGDLRRESGAVEVTIFAVANQQILATSSENPSRAVPRYPGDEVIFQLRQGDSYVSLEPQVDGGLQIMSAVNLRVGASRRESGVLLATFAVEPRLSELVNQAETSYEQYRALSFLRAPLKTSLTATLSIVLLTGLLAAVYGAFFSARRLVVPIQQLMAGTRAVARGDFDTRLPLPARDEIGFLVNSFNDMTKRLAKAHDEARDSQQLVESERGKLEVILARLSTGVVSLEPDMRIRTANQAAGAILGVDLESHLGESLVELAETRPLLSQFLAVSRSHLERGDSDWREQIVLRGEVGRRVLMCACTALPGERDDPGGYVVVFDDITALLQAQRDAAWGEVARRLAHEIKNPLTPIQLSAERLRRRYLESRVADPELLDRATHTIIQQVQAMKEMVNAFSEYARTPDMEVTRFNLNDLITEVTELYRHQELPLELETRLDDDLPLLEADAGRMRQVFHNLIRNALEAMEHSSNERLVISTRGVHDEGMDLVEIKVEDNGPGFLKEIVDEAFDPYVTSKPKGTGLGLAIVKKLVEEHGGQIAARNKEQGGAEISILLPITGEAEDALLLGARRQDKRRERA